MKPRVRIGIDPGRAGALVAIEEIGAGGARRAHAHLMPMVGHNVEFAGLVELLARYEVVYALVERAQAMPGNGATSMFRYGTGYGAILGCLAALQIPHETIRPQRWQVELGIGAMRKPVPAGETKQAQKARRAAARREQKARVIAFVQGALPGLDLMPGRRAKPHDGIADAAALAILATWKG